MSIETVYCRNCGTEIKKNAEVCPECGFENVEYEPIATEEGGEPANDSGGSADGTGIGNRQPSEGTDTGQRSISPEIVDIAAEVEDQADPDASAAQRLCQVLSDESASEDDVRSALEEAVDRLETGAAVSEAVEPADRRSTVEVYENIKRDLDRESGRLPSAVEPLVDRLIRTSRELEQRESDHETVLDEVETVCRAASRSDVVSFESRDTEERLSELAAALRSEEAVIAEPSSPIESVAETVDRRARPSSGLSRELIDGLRAPADESELEATIRESVETIDEYAETRDVLSEIGVEDVRRRLDSLDRELATQDTPAYSHLSDRIRELEALLEDPGSVDDIQLYAIYQEISYYDRTLLPRLSRSLSGGGSDDVDELLSTVRGRIEEIRTDFVSVRPDHNHSIPKHFLDLAEELSADAEAERTARPERAAGVLLAADAVLDHVEELYERNEYSVMLRRLRG